MVGEIGRPAVSSTAPFSRQLFIDRDIRNGNLLAAFSGYRAPDTNRLICQTCEYLVPTKWDEGPLMQFREDDIDRAMRAALGVPLKVAIAQEAVEVGNMTPGELVRFDKVVATPRQGSWLKGRAALKRLLAYLGEDQDTSALVFPNRRFSLSHTEGYAVALGSQGVELEGTGIDLELNRVLGPEAARFFLTRLERRWVTRLPLSAQPVHLLRLWTVKEALFKADPLNGATRLLDYSVEDPGHDTGKACRMADSLLSLRYASLQLEEGYLSIAIACK